MHKFAKSTAVVGTRGGGTTRVVEGEVWSSHDPIVQDNPDLFSDQPTKVKGAKPEVEEATAAPGEKRTTSRKRA